MRWTVPNVLTVLRVLAAPALPLAYVLLPRPLADYVAIGLFLAAAATDWLDGYLARRLDQHSAFGIMLDPIADKAMVIVAAATVIGLAGLNWPILLPLLVILMREVLISGLREFLGDIKLPVTRLAKWKTAVQMAGILGLLLTNLLQWQYERLYYAGATPDDPVYRQALELYVSAFWAALALIWVAGLLTAVTGIDYWRKARPHLLAREGP
ncbi:MAG: CDP-diacylglycerol--glycerol-3-phosphate 3-phosphatidyltransferase [Pseudomonadota bacterium]